MYGVLNVNSQSIDQLWRVVQSEISVTTAAHLPLIQQQFYLPKPLSKQQLTHRLLKLIKEEYQKLLDQSINQQQQLLALKQKQQQLEAENVWVFRDKLKLQTLKQEKAVLQQRQYLLDAQLQLEMERLAQVRAQKQYYQRTNLDTILQTQIKRECLLHKQQEIELWKSLQNLQLELAKQLKIFQDALDFARNNQYNSRDSQAAQQFKNQESTPCPYSGQVNLMKLNLDNLLQAQSESIEATLKQHYVQTEQLKTAILQKTLPWPSHQNNKRDREKMEKLVIKAKKYKALLKKGSEQLNVEANPEARQKLKQIKLKLEKCMQQFDKHKDQRQRYKHSLTTHI